jgi:hypothetical protein
VDYAAGLEATLGWLRERPRRTPRGEAPGQGAAVGLNGAGAGL